MRPPGRTPVAAVMMLSTALALPAARGQALPTQTKVDTEPLELSTPDRYVVPSVLEAIRRVTLVAPVDAVIRSQDAKAGALVREGQEIAQLDKTEAAARLKIAQAEVKKAQAALELVQAQLKAANQGATAAGKAQVAEAQAVVEAALARAELAQAMLDHCTLRAPFPGRLLDSPISDGQFVPRGTVIAELADVSSLRALVPVGRGTAAAGGSITLSVEGQPVTGKIQTILPLPERLAVLRELACPLAAAWVVLPNPSGTLEPGQRVLSPALPHDPLAVIPAQALPKGGDKEETTTIQVIRNEYVTNVKVRVLGHPVPERVQVSGPLRSSDALIVSSTVPLLSGTLIRFQGSGDTVSSVETGSPNPAETGTPASVVPPSPGSRSAPIGAPGSAVPKAKPGVRPAPAAAKPSAPVPF